MARNTQRKEGALIAWRRRPRRRPPLAEKLAIVRECLQPGASLAGVAMAYGANANMIRKWVVKYQRGEYGPLADTAPRLLPVVVKPVKPRAARSSSASPDSTPVIEVELRRGVLRVHGRADPTLLRALVDALSR